MEQQEGTIAEGKPADSAPESERPRVDRPIPWVAAALSFIIPPLGMLNVAQPTWAAVYFFAGTMLARHFEGDEYLPLAVAVLITLGIRVVAAAHAYRLALQYPADKPRPFYSRAPVTVALLIGGVLLLLAVPFALHMAAQASCVGATCE